MTGINIRAGGNRLSFWVLAGWIILLNEHTYFEIREKNFGLGKLVLKDIEYEARGHLSTILHVPYVTKLPSNFAGYVNLEWLVKTCIPFAF